jgi:C-terminal processing protease CtpA/Prc
MDEVSASSPSKHWGPEKVLEIRRVSATQGLGISIVGGKLEPVGLAGDSPPLTGIFIKHVLPVSPAAALGVLNTGDRILAVGDVDLRTASHDTAVEAIRQAGNPLRLCVQSLRQWTEDEEEDEVEERQDAEEAAVAAGDLDRTVGGEEEVLPPVLAPAPEGFASPERPEPPTPSPRTEASLDLPPADFRKAESIESDMTTTDSDDTQDQQGQETLDNGLVIDRSSAAALAKSPSDSELEDEFGYTSEKIQRKYGRQDGVPMYVRLNKGTQGLGISLSGHKDRGRMAVMVAGLHPQGNAARDGQMSLGDTLLEVNGLVLHNRCHLNASTVIKQRPEAGVTFILLRREDGPGEVAVRPVLQFPAQLEESAIERYRKYRGLRQVVLLKGDTGLGIMIVEGKHQESGTGVFISDLQDGSVADKAGLQVGDMILAVNSEDFVGASYETAAKVLKKTEGEIKMIVCNPNLPEKAMKPDPAEAAAPTSPEKPVLPPKPMIAPKPNLSSTALTAPVATPPAVTTAAAKEKKEPAKATPSPKVTPKVDPTKCEIVPGTDTTIEIVKDKDEEGKPMGLGLSIVGGSDTLLGAIFIHEVYEAGAAHKDSRLRPGDQILEVRREGARAAVLSSHYGSTYCSVRGSRAEQQLPEGLHPPLHDPPAGDARGPAECHPQPGATCAQADAQQGAAYHPQVKSLCITALHCTVQLYREDDEIYEQMEVELVKKRDRGLGLSIVGKKSGPGVFISEVGATFAVNYCVSQVRGNLA